MNDFDFEAKLRELAQARQRNAEATHAQDELINRLYNSPRWQELEAQREQTVEEEARLDVAIREAAIALYNKTQNKHPHAAVQIRVYKDYLYDDNAAIEWCKQRLPDAIKTVLNARVFEKTVALLPEKPAFFEVQENPRATVTADLSEYLPPADFSGVHFSGGEAKPGDVDADRIPF